MATADNRPTLHQLLAKLGGVPKSVLDAYEPPTYPALQAVLDESIAYVEQVATTSFNPRRTLEKYDGNGTNQLTLRKRPALVCHDLRVETPILGYVRVYKQDEVKLYNLQGIVKVFTYKLAVEQTMLRSFDSMAWGTLFPPLPQSVHVDYSYGFPLYDAKEDQTSFDGATWVPGDQRDPQLVTWLMSLQEAAIAGAAADFLQQSAGLAVGLVASVSFDGYSRSLNAGAFSTQAQAFTARRDALLARRRRLFAMTVG